MRSLFRQSPAIVIFRTSEESSIPSVSLVGFAKLAQPQSENLRNSNDLRFDLTVSNMDLPHISSHLSGTNRLETW